MTIAGQQDGSLQGPQAPGSASKNNNKGKGPRKSDANPTKQQRIRGPICKLQAWSIEQNQEDMNSSQKTVVNPEVAEALAKREAARQAKSEKMKAITKVLSRSPLLDLHQSEQRARLSPPYSRSGSSVRKLKHTASFERRHAFLSHEVSTTDIFYSRSRADTSLFITSVTTKPVAVRGQLAYLTATTARWASGEMHSVMEKKKANKALKRSPCLLRLPRH